MILQLKYCPKCKGNVMIDGKSTNENKEDYEENGHCEICDIWITTKGVTSEEKAEMFDW